MAAILKTYLYLPVLPFSIFLCKSIFFISNTSIFLEEGVNLTIDSQIG